MSLHPGQLNLLPNRTQLRNVNVPHAEPLLRHETNYTICKTCDRKKRVVTYVTHATITTVANPPVSTLCPELNVSRFCFCSNVQT